MKFTSTVMTGVAGKLGNVVGLMGLGGMAVRAWVNPTNPKSTAQTGVRNTLKTLATAWSETLTQAQRDGWAVYAATLTFTNSLGTPYTISGFDAYVAANGARIVGGLSRVDAPPAVGGFAVYTTPTPSFVVSSHAISMAFTNTDDWAGEVGGAMLVRVSPAGFSPGIKKYTTPFIYAGKVSGAVSPPTSPQTIVLAAGAIVAGMQYAVAVRVVRADGRYSPESIFRGIGA